MLNVKKVLVIGGGIGGMSAAILLRKAGVEVDLVEIDPEWRVYGAGITISGPTLRAFKAVGVLPAIMEQGWCADGATICDAIGKQLLKIPTPRVAGPDVPGAGAILRPVLARILSKETLAVGASVRLGTTFTDITPVGDQVQISFTDGQSSTYDLVIGADGLHSKVRERIFPDAPKPKYTGQGSWRAVVPRVQGIDGATVFMGATTKVGVNPVSKDEMYLFCLDKRPTNDYIPQEQWSEILAGLLTGFSGPVADIRDNMNADSRILYRPLEGILMPAPWHSGHVVLLGDSVHATTPHLASGAGIAVEDAVVLVEELSKGGLIEDTLTRYVQRRHARCSLVVNNSLRLGQLEIDGGSKEEHGNLMRDSIITLAAPI